VKSDARRVEHRRKFAGAQLSILAVMLLSSFAVAQPALTLSQALDQARAQSRDVQAANARLDQASAAVDASRAGLLPLVSLQGRYTRNSKQASIDVPEASSSGGPPSLKTVVITDQNQLDGIIAVTAPLVAPAAWGAYSAARESHQAQEATRDATETAVLVGVAQAFYQAAAADEALAARHHSVEVARRTWDDALALIEAGRATRVDGARAQLALIRAEQAEEEAIELRSRAYRALATLISKPEAFQVTPPSVPAEDAPVAPGPRPDLVAVQRTASAQHAQAFASALRWAPALSAFGSVRATSAAGMSGEHAPWAVGLQLDWAIYDGGNRDAARRSAEATEHEAELRAAQLSAQISDEVANAVAAVKLKRTAIAAAQRAVELATQTLELTRVQQEGGRTTQLELLQAQDALVGSELTLAQSRLDFGLAETELKRATGGVLQ
jgi:outer membrane protein TolC